MYLLRILFLNYLDESSEEERVKDAIIFITDYMAMKWNSANYNELWKELSCFGDLCKSLLEIIGEQMTTEEFINIFKNFSESRTPEEIYGLVNLSSSRRQLKSIYPPYWICLTQK